VGQKTGQEKTFPVRTPEHVRPAGSETTICIDPDYSTLSPANVLGIARFVKTAAHSRAGGRTVLVFPTSMLTERAPLLESIAEIEVPDAKIKIFNDLDSGLSWLSA